MRLPERTSALRLLPLAIAEGVEFAPGSQFFTNRAEGEGYLRLKFVTQTQAYRAYGYDFPANSVRVEQLEEAVWFYQGNMARGADDFRGPLLPGERSLL